jgi:ATP-dependent exoDNAse (exonuclease V), alpha subunit - helicase superfamily I member
MKDYPFTPNPQQRDVLHKLAHWIVHETSEKQVFRLFGYAGTGKTTLARVFASALKRPVVFCAFTGKAALRMEQAGCQDAMTLHSLLYVPAEDASGRMRWIRRTVGPIDQACLVIVDEGSMVNQEIARDLLSFGKPVLVLGDPAQLPPVDGEGFFMQQDPDFLLTTIERTAEDNPLLELATAAREGRPIRIGSYGASEVVPHTDLERIDLLAFDQVIVGTNKLRLTLNIEIRKLRGRTGPLPVVGDRLIGLKNDSEAFVRNGEQFVVVAVDGIDEFEDTLILQVQSLDQPQTPVREVKVPPACFTQEKVEFWRWDEAQFMTYGYAITGHKSQGSEWNSVLVIDESHICRENAPRWLYTVLTRARERVTMVTAG